MTGAGHRNLFAGANLPNCTDSKSKPAICQCQDAEYWTARKRWNLQLKKSRVLIYTSFETLGQILVADGKQCVNFALLVHLLAAFFERQKMVCFLLVGQNVWGQQLYSHSKCQNLHVHKGCVAWWLIFMRILDEKICSWWQSFAIWFGFMINCSEFLYVFRGCWDSRFRRWPKWISNDIDPFCLLMCVIKSSMLDVVLMNTAPFISH